MIDTGIFIAAERGRIDLDNLLAKLAGPVGIASVTAAELLVGVYRADDQNRSKRQTAVETILGRFPRLAGGLPHTI